MHSRRPASRCVPAGVKSGTLPAITTSSNVCPRSKAQRSSTRQSRSGERRRAVATIDASASTPTTATPRRASSRATRPVPQPASRTEVGAKRMRNSTSPWTSTPLSASASNRFWYSSPSQLMPPSSRASNPPVLAGYSRENGGGLGRAVGATACHPGDRRAPRRHAPGSPRGSRRSASGAPRGRSPRSAARRRTRPRAPS